MNARTSKIRTPLAELLGLTVPIIQAPMAGGPSSPELVAAASSAGALGSFGFSYAQPADMQRQAALVREKTDRPFGINLFVAPVPGEIPAAAQRAALDAVTGYYAELGLPAPEPVRAPYAPDLAGQLAMVEELRPRVFTTHFGSLPAANVKALQARGIRVGGSATCVAEAKNMEALGFDFVIAQGGEAGGHRGSWLRDPYQALTGTLALVRLIVNAVRLPVVAAGGIMDGAGIAAVLALGAQAAQLGTAFIPCPESGAWQVHKDALLGLEEDNSALTEKFSGRPARGLVNRFLREMNDQDAAQLAFPAQNNVTSALRAAAARSGRPEFVALWAGQAAPLTRALPAAALIARLEAETVDAIRRMSSFVAQE